MTQSEKPSQCVLSYRGLSVAVHSNEPAPLRWLEEFCTPCFTDNRESASQREIRVIINSQAYEQLSAHTADSGTREIDCFTMDDKFQRHILCDGSGDGRLIHILDAKSFMHIGAGDEPIKLTAHADHWAMRSVLMRIVRELATQASLRRGDLFAHVAAAVYKGRAILFAGSKGAGKTTMLLNALRQPGVDFLSNDRVMVELSSSGPVARGMPTIIRVWPECLACLPTLRKPVWQHPYRFYMTMKESANGADILLPTPLDIPGMYTAQLCRWFGVRAIAAAPAAAMVFPIVDSNVERFELRSIEGDELADRLPTGLFSTGCGGTVPEAFDRMYDGRFPDERATRDAFMRLAGQCRMYDCRIGPQAYGSPNVWDAIVDAIR